MSGEKSHSNGVAMDRVGQDGRVALTGGGIEIRREGRPLASTALGGGSVYLVIDCSGSMAGGKIAQAKKGALDFAERALSKRYAVGMISFAFVATHICEPREKLSQVLRNLPRLEPKGSTNMADGIELATSRLRGKPGPLAMIVITDGVPDDQNAALRAAGDAKKYGIDVITVGTNEADRSFLRRLASRSDWLVVVKSEQLGPGIAAAAEMLPGGPEPAKEL